MTRHHLKRGTIFSTWDAILSCAITAHGGVAYLRQNCRLVEHEAKWLRKSPLAAMSSPWCIPDHVESLLPSRRSILAEISAPLSPPPAKLSQRSTKEHLLELRSVESTTRILGLFNCHRNFPNHPKQGHRTDSLHHPCNNNRRTCNQGHFAHKHASDTQTEQRDAFTKKDGHDRFTL